MMQKILFMIFGKQMNILRLGVLFIGLGFLLNNCFLKQDRTTVVYGTITDQNGQPVDSILVVMDGVRGFIYEPLKEAHSDINGDYELVMEVPKQHSSTNVYIPFGSSINPKYQSNYSGFKLRRNEVNTLDCRFATVGEKTKYDFQLIPK